MSRSNALCAITLTAEAQSIEKEPPAHCGGRDPLYLRLMASPHIGEGVPPAGPSGGLRASTPTARFRSPVEITAGLLRGRWTALILWNLFWGGKRFYRLLRDLPGIPRKTLAGELQEMERVGLIERQFQRRSLDGVEYTLSVIGESLKPVLVAMYEWGLLVRNLPVAEGLTSLEQPRPQAEHSRPTENPQSGDALGPAEPSDAR
jgi:DNA-binding HxlR family transcriptional regulator